MERQPQRNSLGLSALSSFMLLALLYCLLLHGMIFLSSYLPLSLFSLSKARDLLYVNFLCCAELVTNNEIFLAGSSDQRVKEYAVLEFPPVVPGGAPTVALVPDKWVEEEEKLCWWPKYISTSQLEKAVALKASVSPFHAVYIYKIFRKIWSVSAD